MKRTLADYLPLPGRLESIEDEITGLAIEGIRFVVTEVLRNARSGSSLRMTLRCADGSFVEVCREAFGAEWVVERMWPILACASRVTTESLPD